MAMAMTTSKTVYRAGHAPLPGGVYVAPFPDPLAPDQDAAIDEALTGFDHLLLTQTAPGETAAMILEPVLGEGGYIPAPQAFLDRPRRALPRRTASCSSPTRCRAASGGPARCSRSITSASSPTSSAWRRASRRGFPFSALGTRRELDDQWPKGSHGGTYGGNPIGCAAALATIEVMSEPGFLDNVVARGEQLSDAAFASCSRRIPTSSRQVRGLGLMVASELPRRGTRAGDHRSHCLEEGRLILMNAGTYGT